MSQFYNLNNAEILSQSMKILTVNIRVQNVLSLGSD